MQYTQYFCTLLFQKQTIFEVYSLLSFLKVFNCPNFYSVKTDVKIGQLKLAIMTGILIYYNFIGQDAWLSDSDELLFT